MQKINIITVLFAMFFLLADSCKKKEPNIPPSKPTIGFPADAATDIALDATLSWQAAVDPEGSVVSYDVYFGTDATATTKVSSDQTNTTYSPTLAGNTTYYWKIVAIDVEGAMSESSVWSFTTLNGAPGTVTLSSPADAATDVALDATLSWLAAIDPEGSVVFYDVYFGTDATVTTKVSSDQTNTTYSPTLASNTTYYWKIVAKDVAGAETESSVWSFTMNNVYGSVTDVDGNTYKTVTIGNQEWMAENLKVTHYPNGTAIDLITDNIAWTLLGDNDSDDAYCYYDNSITNRDTYGALYTYAAAKDACPTGWHLPSDEEWTTLESYISNDGHNGTEAVALKATIGWDDNGNGTDDYGFAALPGGRRSISNGTFGTVNIIGFWWGSQAANFGSAYIRRMSTVMDDVSRIDNNKSSGYSVRCLKD